MIGPTPPPAMIDRTGGPVRSFVVPAGHDMPQAGDAFWMGVFGMPQGVRIEGVQDRTAWWLPIPDSDVPDGAQPWPYGSVLT